MSVPTKQAAFNLFEEKRAEFLAHLRWVAKRKAESTLDGIITIDDVRDDVITPEGVNPKVYGAVFNTPDWEKVGYTQTRRESSHGRMVCQYRYVHFKHKTNKRIFVDGNLALF